MALQCPSDFKVSELMERETYIVSKICAESELKSTQCIRIEQEIRTEEHSNEWMNKKKKKKQKKREEKKKKKILLPLPWFSQEQLLQFCPISDRCPLETVSVPFRGLSAGLCSRPHRCRQLSLFSLPLFSLSPGNKSREIIT